MGLAENIKKYRLEKNMTLEEVAEIVGVSRQTIQKYESGIIVNIPFDKILKIAKALDVSAGTLMGWVRVKEKTKTERYKEFKKILDNYFKDFIESREEEKNDNELIIDNLELNVKFQEKIIDFLKEKNALLGIKKEEYELEEMADKIIEYIEFINQKPTRRLSEIEKKILRGKTQD